MKYGDYVRMLILENDEKEEIKRNKLLDAEKAQYSVSMLIINVISMLIFLNNIPIIK
jgi:hypothetical protein